MMHQEPGSTGAGLKATGTFLMLGWDWSLGLWESAHNLGPQPITSGVSLEVWSVGSGLALGQARSLNPWELVWMLGLWGWPDPREDWEPRFAGLVWRFLDTRLVLWWHVGLGPWEAASCWGGSKAWVHSSRPDAGLSKKPGFFGAYMESGIARVCWDPGAMGASWGSGNQLVPKWAGGLDSQEPAGSLGPWKPTGVIVASRHWAELGVWVCRHPRAAT